jgi:hypothetical protein
MSEPRADRRSWPAGLLGALVLIAAVESFVARHELDFTTPARMEWRQSRLAATDRAPACAVLGLGTSMSKLGVYPSVIERESGRRTFNLACCAGRIPGSYYLLRRALDAGARPEAILLEVHPAYLAWPFQEGMVAWPDLLAPADCLDLAWTARDASFFASTILSRALPRFARRFWPHSVVRSTPTAWPIRPCSATSTGTPALSSTAEASRTTEWSGLTSKRSISSPNGPATSSTSATCAACSTFVPRSKSRSTG